VGDTYLKTDFLQLAFSLCQRIFTWLMFCPKESSDCCAHGD